MAKLMLAWRGPGAGLWHDEATHAAVRDAGGLRLQVNEDDEPVARAMRISTDDVPVAAVTSVWTDGDLEPIVDVAAVLADQTGATVEAWEVSERRPIDPPETWDGTRVDALANVALLRRPADLDEAEWRRRWLEEHTPVAIETQASFGYVQNVVERALTGQHLTPVSPVGPVAALVEELFPSDAVTDTHAFYGSGGDDAELHRRLSRMMDSCARFGADRDLDLMPSGRFLYDLSR